MKNPKSNPIKKVDLEFFQIAFFCRNQNSGGHISHVIIAFLLRLKKGIAYFSVNTTQVRHKIKKQV